MFKTIALLFTAAVTSTQASNPWDANSSKNIKKFDKDHGLVKHHN